MTDADRLDTPVSKSTKEIKPGVSDDLHEVNLRRADLQAAARNEMFATAFWLLESGDLNGADLAFAEFLQETTDDPSRMLRPTVMLARSLLNSSALGLDGPPEADEVIVTVLSSVINSNRPG